MLCGQQADIAMMRWTEDLQLITLRQPLLQVIV